MASQLFARRSSGLVKEAGLLDAFATGFMNQGLTFNFWLGSSFGLFLFPKADLVWAAFIAMVWCTLGQGLVWGILGGSMPRSAGDYVYASRILHPLIGVVNAAISGVFVIIAWLWTLSPLYVKPGFTTIFGMLGAADLVARVTQPDLTLLIATLAIFYGFVFGALMRLRYFALQQRVLMVLALVTFSIVMFFGLSHSHQDFVNAWNVLANQYGSYDYQGLINAVKAQGYPVGTGVDWVSTVGLATSVYGWWAEYAYVTVFISGEVKRPERNLIVAQTSAVVIPGLLMMLVGFLLQGVIGREFTVASAYVEQAGLPGYKMPFTPDFVTLSGIFTTNKLLLIIMGSSVLLSILIWMPLQFVAAPRYLMGFGMDRLGPKWFTDVNPRTHTLLKNCIFVFIVAELGVVGYLLNPVLGSWIGGSANTVVQYVTTFTVAALCAIAFPFVKKARHIWNASPHNWKIGPIPLATIAGIISLGYFWIGGYFYFSAPALYGAWQIWVPMLIGVTIFMVIWYYAFKAKAAKEGVDISLAFKELPPE
ncbi:MAG: amino acid permease [Candidatus Bathyarchaeia archaeon]